MVAHFFSQKPVVTPPSFIPTESRKTFSHGCVVRNESEHLPYTRFSQNWVNPILRF